MTMGGEESHMVRVRSTKQDSQKHDKFCHHHRIRGMTETSLEWSLVHTCSLKEWCKYGHSTTFAFDSFIDSRYLHSHSSGEYFLQNLQLYCTHGCHFTIERMQNNRKGSEWKKFPHQRRETRIRQFEALRTPNVSIIGYHRRIVILEVVYKKTKELHFLVVELSTGKHLSLYRDIYINEPCIYEAYISPDESHYLLRPNFYFAHQRSTDPYTTFTITRDIRLFDITQWDSKLVDFIEDISVMWYSIAFDPSRGHSLIALGNYSVGRAEDVVALYDLNAMRVVCVSDSLPSPTALLSHHMVYNPQGTMLVSLSIRLISLELDKMYPTRATFYNARNLEVFHVIELDGVSMTHMQTSLTPRFSRTGNYVVLARKQLATSGTLTMSVYQMPRDEISLSHLCRICILSFVSEQNICALPLPSKLQSYLLFQPEVCLQSF